LSCYVGLRSAGSRGVFHDHEGFYVLWAVKPFAIMNYIPLEGIEFVHSFEYDTLHLVNSYAGRANRGQRNSRRTSPDRAVFVVVTANGSLNATASTWIEPPSHGEQAKVNHAEDTAVTVEICSSLTGRSGTDLSGVNVVRSMFRKPGGEARTVTGLKLIPLIKVRLVHRDRHESMGHREVDQASQGRELIEPARQRSGGLRSRRA